MSFTLHVLLFSTLPFILCLLVLKSHFRSSKPRKNLPPSPPKLPLIGNLHQLGSSTHRAFQAMAKSYGPLMLVHLGTVPVLIVSSMDTAKEIMKTHDLAFASRAHSNIPNRIFYACKDIAFSPYGEYWRQAKSIAVLHLLTHKRVQSYHHIRHDEMALMMDTIRTANGSVVNLSDLLITLTNNVFCRVALGRKYEGREFKHLLARTLDLLGSFSVGSYIPSLRWVDRLSGLEAKADKVAQEFDEFFEGVVDEHEHAGPKNESVEGRDLVDILLEFQRENVKGFRLEREMIKAIILDLFFAGTDTTFTSLEWVMAELLRNPRAMKELQREAVKTGQGRSVISEDDLDKMPYLKAVLKESLRMHAPLPLLIPREATTDVKVLGYDIKEGTQVLINVWAIGRDPSNWEEPDEFRPERFLNSPIDYKGFHFELLPFGAGRRGCPGIQFGMVVNELVLANLVYKFDLALVGEESLDMSETNGITVHKKCPILVSATPRF